MKKSSIKKLNMSGWMLAIALLGAMVGMGANSNAEKVGVVDLQRVVKESEVGKENIRDYEQATKLRENFLEFLARNKVLSAERIKEMKDLMLLEKPTAEQSAKLEAIKSEALDAQKEYSALSQKKNPSEEDKKKLDEYALRSRITLQAIQQYQQAFREELMTLRGKRLDHTLDEARGALKSAAENQGFTQVFDSSVLLYGANDVTDKTIEAMNKGAKKKK